MDPQPDHAESQENADIEMEDLIDKEAIVPESTDQTKAENALVASNIPSETETNNSGGENVQSKETKEDDANKNVDKPVDNIVPSNLEQIDTSDNVDKTSKSETEPVPSQIETNPPEESSSPPEEKIESDSSSKNRMEIETVDDEDQSMNEEFSVELTNDSSKEAIKNSKDQNELNILSNSVETTNTSDESDKSMNVDHCSPGEEVSKKCVDIDEDETLVVNSDMSSNSSGDYDDTDENVSRYYDKFDICSEGKAKILIPQGKKGVFYNPVQEFNRDLSVAVLTVFAKDHMNDPTVKKFMKKKMDQNNSDSEDDEDEGDLPPRPGRKCNRGLVILDALSATGLRSMRYGLEVPGVNTVKANDMSDVAVNIIDKNIELNDLLKIVYSTHFDAVDLMQLERIRGRHFDAIDLDPFGNPTRFLNAAVGSVRDGGLLLVTCTDMAILCGNTPESCYVKYDSVSLKTAACHEMALRICLHLIQSVCSKFGRYISPVLSIHADFYIRVFVKVFTSPQTCKTIVTKTSWVYKCTGCNTLTFQPLCVMNKGQTGKSTFSPSRTPVEKNCIHCEGAIVMAGPIWTGSLHNASFVQEILKATSLLNLKNTRRIVGMLTVILEELAEVPLYYTLPNLCSVLHCEVIPMQEFRSALLHANYKVSLSHCSKNSVKTNAPMEVIWDILRCWVKKHPVGQKRLEDPVVRKILSKEPSLEANFSFHENSVAESDGLLRYQPNPQPFWGPGKKSMSNTGDTMQPKQQKKNRSYESDSARPSPKRFKPNAGTTGGGGGGGDKTGSGSDGASTAATTTTDDQSIELITLSDEDGDSLDKEIFNLTKSDDHVEGLSKTSSVIQNRLKSVPGAKKAMTEKIIEEYNLCDDDDDDDELTIVNGSADSNTNSSIDKTSQLSSVKEQQFLSKILSETKMLADLEDDLNEDILEFDKAQAQKNKANVAAAALKENIQSSQSNENKNKTEELFDIDEDMEDVEGDKKERNVNKPDEAHSKRNKEVKDMILDDDEDDDIFEVDECNEPVVQSKQKTKRNVVPESVAVDKDIVSNEKKSVESEKELKTDSKVNEENTVDRNGKEHNDVHDLTQDDKVNKKIDEVSVMNETLSDDVEDVHKNKDESNEVSEKCDKQQTDKVDAEIDLDSEISDLEKETSKASKDSGKESEQDLGEEEKEKNELMVEDGKKFDELDKEIDTIISEEKNEKSNVE